MSRYIDAYKLIAAVRSFFITMINEAEPLMADDEEAFDLKIANPLLEANKVIRRIIREQTTVDVVKVVHGEWIPLLQRGWLVEGGEKDHIIKQQCSVCQEWVDGNNNFNYCPNCGARMEVEDGKVH